MVHGICQNTQNIIDTCQTINMAASVTEFEPWLNDKLKSLNTDEGVFGSYISGILDAEDTLDDKKDALEGILSEFVVSWNSTHDIITFFMVNHLLNVVSLLFPGK